MEFKSVTVFGSAGGTRREGRVHADIVASQCDTVESVRLLVDAAPEMLACLEAYALPALDYLSHKATSAADRKEFAARVETVRAVIAKAKGV